MIAIFVGHSRSGDNGAVSTGGVSEHKFNSTVARELHRLLGTLGIASAVIDHYEGNGYTSAMTWVAAKARELKATAALELHFNAATPTANGHEFLYWASSTGGRKLAAAFAESYQDYFPESRPRQNGGTLAISSAADRGSQFLRKTHCPAIILEPFFGSNKAEWETASADPQRIAHAYAGAIVEYLR